MDLPRSFTIRESSHRIHNPFTSEKLAALGRALGPRPGWRVLELASGTGEMLCTWARDHQVTGTGVDISAAFIAEARDRATELGVATKSASFMPTPRARLPASGRRRRVHGSDLDRRRRSRHRRTPARQPAARRADVDRRALLAPGITRPGHRRRLPRRRKDEFLPLPGLVGQFGRLGYDVVEMVLANQDGWDRYLAAQWLNTRRWLTANPGDELAGQMRAELPAPPCATPGTSASTSAGGSSPS